MKILKFILVILAVLVLGGEPELKTGLLTESITKLFVSTSFLTAAYLCHLFQKFCLRHESRN